MFLWERYSERIAVTLLIWGGLGGLLFLLVDAGNLTSVQSGWLFKILRIPTYFCSLADLSLIVLLILVVIYEWIQEQVEAYQEFSINGGKEKRKNDEEETQ